MAKMVNARIVARDCQRKTPRGRRIIKFAVE
jgi:hypothetical protein